MDIMCIKWYKGGKDEKPHITSKVVSMYIAHLPAFTTSSISVILGFTELIEMENFYFVDYNFHLK